MRRSLSHCAPRNVLSDRPLYRWSHISIDGRDVRASNGVEIRVDAGVGTEIKFDILLVCAGGNPSRFNHTPTLRWLRRIARMGIPLGGVSGGLLRPRALGPS